MILLTLPKDSIILNRMVSPLALSDDQNLVMRLRLRDEEAFMGLVQQYHSSLVRLASIYVNDEAVAEDVAQETWLGVLKGLERFEGRSSLKTWIFTILTNRAKTRAQREKRTLPFSALEDPDNSDSGEFSVDPDRFRPTHDPEWAGHWKPDERPTPWQITPEASVLSKELRARIEQSIELLPPGPRAVITMRDLEGWTSEEVCNVLEISETNQRVLLHRARAKVRRALEMYFDEAS